MSMQWKEIRMKMTLDHFTHVLMLEKWVESREVKKLREMKRNVKGVRKKKLNKLLQNLLE